VKHNKGGKIILKLYQGRMDARVMNRHPPIGNEDRSLL
jgi:hypothetical protein